MEQETASIMEETVHSAATTRGKGELRSQRGVHENDTIEGQRTWAKAAIGET
jgi:hypothetical protein